jgi:hypothetical protein
VNQIRVLVADGENVRAGLATQRFKPVRWVWNL